MEIQYIMLLKNIAHFGHHKKGRNGWVHSLYNQKFDIDCSNQFPLLTLKEMWFKGILEEFNWYLSGSKSTKELKDKGVHIWDQWEIEPNMVGPSYGFTLAKWDDNSQFNQYAQLINQLKKDPNSRRHIISLWNPINNQKVVLPPCLPYFQFYVVEDVINLTIVQRSCDAAVGLPWDIATGALFLYAAAFETGLKIGSLYFHIVDAHLYDAHLDYYEQIKYRVPKTFPTLQLAKPNLDKFYYTGELANYVCHSKIAVKPIK